MTTSATSGSAGLPGRSHGRSPWREAFEMLARRPVGADASVNLKRNSKGAVEIDVLARGETATGASNGAQIEFDALCAKYPYPVEGAVSPPTASDFIPIPELDKYAGGRSRARGKA